MPIQILPARLANQIAAGEVVERPASVIKELVENSLDAGASQIDVEIEKGGHKRLCVRDNGCGIGKGELTLALSRHATSKIHSLDDLEQIMTLGFRGEALASVSSVARLTLTSRTAEQQQAWQAHAEGRDMQVQLNPAAHPQGTSVEVLDLFFNTPARRKFLRTEKTEFSHIDEVMRRIALSRFDVAFTLKHNGKLVRKYPAIKAQDAKVRRIGAVCGNEFTDHSLEILSKYQDMQLSGWLGSEQAARRQNDLQYFYVNGRMMRDKLINHAVRQAFAGLDDEDAHPAYVLYLNIDPHQVDVNVHPAKHEVRFHQARLVHDFIYRALLDALEQPPSEAAPERDVSLPQVTPDHDYIKPLRQVESPAAEYRTGAAGSAKTFGATGSVNRVAARNYQTLMRSPDADERPVQPCPWFDAGEGQLLIKLNDHIYRLPAVSLIQARLLSQYEKSVPVSQPLLMPISIPADPKGLGQAKALADPLLANSVEIGWTDQRILLRKVPAGMRQLPWSEILPGLLDCQSSQALQVRQHLIQCLAKQLACQTDTVNNELWRWMQAQYPDNWQAQIKTWGKPVPLLDWLKQQ